MVGPIHIFAPRKERGPRALKKQADVAEDIGQTVNSIVVEVLDTVAQTDGK